MLSHLPFFHIQVIVFLIEENVKNSNRERREWIVPQCRIFLRHRCYSHFYPTTLVKQIALGLHLQRPTPLRYLFENLL